MNDEPASGHAAGASAGGGEDGDGWWPKARAIGVSSKDSVALTGLKAAEAAVAPTEATTADVAGAGAAEVGTELIGAAKTFVDGVDKTPAQLSRCSLIL